VPDLVAVFQRSARVGQHPRDSDIVTRCDNEIACVHDDCTLKAVEPLREPVPKGSSANILERRNYVEVHDFFRIQRNQAIDVPVAGSLGSRIEERSDFGLRRVHSVLLSRLVAHRRQYYGASRQLVLAKADVELCSRDSKLLGRLRLVTTTGGERVSNQVTLDDIQWPWF
jgi:hypothetical protein